VWQGGSIESDSNTQVWQGGSIESDSNKTHENASEETFESFETGAHQTHLQTLVGHKKCVTSLAVGADGRIYSGSQVRLCLFVCFCISDSRYCGESVIQQSSHLIMLLPFVYGGG
jgi:hypothetical protein